MFLQAQSEDCLFLDVIAPFKLFDRQRSKSKLAPVLFQVHGGGFFRGETKALPPPNGLFEAGNSDSIYVLASYRVDCYSAIIFIQLTESAWRFWLSISP